MVNLVLLARVLRAKTKKGRQHFREKVHPTENPGYAHAGYSWLSSWQGCRLQPESEFWLLWTHRVEQAAICCVRDKTL